MVPNWSGNGGISVISPSGATHHIQSRFSNQLRPNGIALIQDGHVLMAHLGETSGAIYRLSPDGRAEEIISTADDLPLPPVNFVVCDSHGRIWLTVSTRAIPRANDYRKSANTGFIAVAEPGSSNARIVADGLGYTNECVIDEQNRYMWVNETFGRRLTRFAIDDFDSTAVSLNHPSVVCTFGEGTYPDGLALDESGCLWITSIISNRIVRVSADGESQLVFEDSDQQHLERTELAYRTNTLGREHLDRAYGQQMKNISSVAFGGASRNKLYIGNLLGSSLPWLETASTGKAPVHWTVPLGKLESFLD